jgi:hypothetical protein
VRESRALQFAKASMFVLHADIQLRTVACRTGRMERRARIFQMIWEHSACSGSWVI